MYRLVAYLRRDCEFSPTVWTRFTFAELIHIIYLIQLIDSMKFNLTFKYVKTVT